MFNKIKNKLPSQKELQKHFVYLESGHLMSRRTGKISQFKNNRNYLQIYFKGKRYLAHRLIWKYFNNFDPNVINHINFNICDNRIENLQNVTHSENSMHRRGPNKNNKLGIRNVTFVKSRNKYNVVIQGKFYGQYNTLPDAIAMLKNQPNG